MKEDNGYISKKPIKCECGCTSFIDTPHAWHCSKCGKNHGKSIARFWVDREIQGKMKRIEDGRLRPDVRTAKVIRKEYDEDGETKNVFSETTVNHEVVESHKKDIKRREGKKGRVDTGC